MPASRPNACCRDSNCALYALELPVYLLEEPDRCNAETLYGVAGQAVLSRPDVHRFAQHLGALMCSQEQGIFVLWLPGFCPYCSLDSCFDPFFLGHRAGDPGCLDSAFFGVYASDVCFGFCAARKALKMNDLKLSCTSSFDPSILTANATA